MAAPTWQTFSRSAAVGNNVASMAHTIPSGWAVGDLVIALVAHRNSTISAAPAGWTFIATEQTRVSWRISAYYKILEAGDINAPHAWTVSVQAVNKFITYHRITGFNSAAPINVSGTSENVAGTTHNVSAVTTTVDDCLVIRFSSAALATTPVSGSHGTLLEEAVNASNSFGFVQSAAGSTGSAVYSTAAAQPSNWITLAVAPAAAGGLSLGVRAYAVKNLNQLI